MEPTTKWVTGALVFAGIIFALSPGPQHFIANPDGWEFREQAVYLTGVSAMSLMVLSIVISVRLPWVNRWMQGLDKAYVVHKWTGIFATLLLMFHWLGELGPEWLVEWELIPNPGDLSDASSYSELEIELFQSGVALAQVAFYGSIILVVIALFREIPYRFFRKSHKVFPVLFLMAAYHGATAQLKEHWLGTPASYLLLILIAVGVLAAIVSLTGRIGASRKITATISEIIRHEHGILDLRLTTNHKPFLYKPGQYAFLQFEHDKEPHPFSIASSGESPTNLRFAIKSLGDFTHELASQLQVGKLVQVEGPYGEFQFEAPGRRQIWIAGGIGITPFMARLEYLVYRGGSNQLIDFWYSTRSDKSSVFPGSLDELCRQSGVTLYHLNSTRKEYLTADMIYQTVGSFDNVSIWFCGPPAFAQCLLNGLSAYGFDKRSFHYDSFNMR
jgi:predicted ferric reductase